ncbi:MAG: transglycosylase SLT domain-containing protein [Cloacibacillus sp.]
MSSVNSPTAPSRVLHYRHLAVKWARQTGLPPALILAVIDQESDGRAEARRYEKDYTPSARHSPAMNKAGVPLAVQKTSYGLMQLMFPVAWGYGARSTADLEDPDKAIRYGAAHLGQLYKKYNSNILQAAGAYNGAGPKSKYARDVLTLYNKYSKEV